MNTTSNRKLLVRRALVVACIAGLAASASAQAAGQGASSWREYARRSIMPDYAWNDAPPAQSLAPTLRDQVLGARQQMFTLALSDAKASVQRSLTLSLRDAPAGAGYGSAGAAPAALDLTTHASPLRSQFFDTTFHQDVDSLGRMSVSAVIARQQFATPGLGLMRGFHDGASSLATPDPRALRESVSGQGVRFSYRLPVGDRLAWAWSAQSKLEMNPFESVRGIYGEPGDFDLPARMGGLLEWQATAAVSFGLGAERVYFSQITPFTSSALPARLLSLMGDGNAPAFAWRDLTVYSAETRIDDRWHGQWLLRYTTRQQPTPTAALYQSALAQEYTDTNVAFGYRRGLRGGGELAFTASYAPSMAFLGPGPVFARQTYARGAVAEFEASWIVPF